MKKRKKRRGNFVEADDSGIQTYPFTQIDANSLGNPDRPFFKWLAILGDRSYLGSDQASGSASHTCSISGELILQDATKRR